MRPRTTALERLRFAADAGRHFLRVLGQQALSRSYDATPCSRRIPLAPLTDAERQQLDAGEPRVRRA